MIAERLTAQLLAGTPADDPVAVADRLLALQAQDPRGARLAIRARTAGGSAADVDRALTEDRSLVITWLNRGTLHLVRSEDYPWVQSLTTPPLFAGVARRLGQEGVAPAAAERGVKVIQRALSEEGPLTRAQLRERLKGAGVRTERQALVYVLMLACLRGLIVRGPMIGREHAYVLVREWLGETRPLSRERALAELARRYLAGHGPADDRDLARWAGLPLRDARAGLGALGGELRTRADGLVDLKARARAEALPPARLLGQFDPLLLGWKSREAFLGEHDRRVVSGGIFRPIALVGGRAVGTWRLNAGTVALEPFGELSRTDGEALAAEAEEVTRFLGGA
jgi:hypothetical protein